jgi:CSLREA domain-containing protein
VKVLASVLIVVGCLLAAPAAALAVEYTVDSTLDEPDDNIGAGGCHTAGNVCTLRAAIQESNASVGTKDTIKFAAAFNGELADTIALGASFPIITDPVTIDGNGTSSCEPIATIEGPCVGVSGPTGGFGLQVEDDEVTIEGLAVTGALTGISVINASSEFTARANWIGVKLDGTAGANNTGIFVDPDSDLARIGTAAITGRNVIANNNNIGLDIQGADGALVLGNYFGVAPNGTTAAPNPINIEITDSTAGGGFTAEENEVGGTILLPEQQSAACDGACNVISGATSTGIDLDGNGAGENEAPASGPTTVHGNYVGIGATGMTVVANATFGIISGASDETTIGGPGNGDANFIAGGGTGIYHENGEGFLAAGNVIGAAPSGADLTSPSLGMFVFCMNNANPVEVGHNVILMEGGTGIEQRFGGAEIFENLIAGAQQGILTFADPGLAGGNLIEDNVIGESVLSGIQIENDDNEVIGNEIFDSGGPGIRIQNQGALVQATGNVIGGNTKDDENTIREGSSDAIEIIDTSGASEPSFNEVARNHGDENSALFIDLIGAIANDGILPPAFATSQQSSASGSGAEPGATVRVFRKAEPGPGEIESFLAEAPADGGGKWKVSYPAAIPVGTLVAATQTSVAGGTSELAIATTTADPAGGDKDKDKDEKPKDNKPKADKKAPETTIVKGPKARSRKRTAKFRFTSSEAGSTFQCKLDKKKFKPCRSPKKYKRLKPGKHVFEVRAIDPAGNRDKTPATRKFRVLPRR